MRESFQDAEVYFYVQNALRDETKRARLGRALLKRCTAACDMRTDLFRYYYWYMSVYEQTINYDPFFDETPLLKNSEELYGVVGEVAQALGK